MGIARHLVESRFAGGFASGVSDEIDDFDAAVLTDKGEGNFARVQQSDEERARNPEPFGRLLRGELLIFRN